MTSTGSGTDAATPASATFIGTIPGASVAWVIIALLEGVVFQQMSVS